ncbi:trafficking protein particle complex subunit 10 [Flammula alnicola]|nr:trafficking protein particle complex subunit 10 [Flammula alnicola]
MTTTSTSSNQRVLVSYTAPPTFLASPNWNKVYGTILGQFPLRNIHWKSHSRASVKTIQELDVTLLPFDSLRDEHTSQVPGTLLEKPLLHVYIVHCEDNDIETYRNTLKKQIKDWHSAVTSRKNQEWLILQIIRPDSSRQATGTFFQIKNSVLDKLKTDFNSDKRDRCIQVNWVTGNENPVAWAEFISKIKDGLLYAFDSAIELRQEEVRRSENQQSMPGWNFCTFFILKESLASSFEGMNLFEEALIPYDELESSFYRVSREKNMSWFGSLIPQDPKDDVSPLLSITRKSYRELILANTISVFDFRIYLLARQCQLLAKMGRMNEITSKVGFFLGAFGKRLREVESTLPPLFIEAWTYSAALSAVEHCNEWATTFKIEGSKSASVNAGKGELLDLARSQLDILGMEAGHLPTAPPFSTSKTSTKSLPSGTVIRLSNETLNTAINDKEVFYDLYIAITNRAIDLYAKSGRRKFALKLHGNLAALELHRGNLSAALNTYTSLPAHYAPHMWTSLESFMLSRALDTYSKLDMAQDVEWIHIVLSFLKTYVEHNSEMLMYRADKVDYVTNLVKSLRISVERLETDLAHPDHPILTIRVSSNAKLAETRDGSYLDVYVTNYLPCVFPVDEISVLVTGRESEKFRYVSPVTEGCLPGKSTFTLFCPTSASGTFILESSEVRSAHLLLQSNYRKTSKGPSSATPLLVRVPNDPLALDVRISQSNRIELGKPQSLMVVLSTGRNKIDKLIVRMTSPSVTFRCREAILLEDQDIDSINATEDGIEMEEVEDDIDVTFLVPHSDASALTAMKVNIEVEYITEYEPSIVRSSHFIRVLITTLPISVNVEDFFRGTRQVRLISKFTVSTTSHQHVRIADASLDLPQGGLQGVNIQPSLNKRRVITVTPPQPANFLFALDSSNGPVRESLTLRIKYRMLREEVESIIQDQVRAILEESPATLQRRIVLVGKLIDALESDAAWVDMYGITGELAVPHIAKEDGEVGDLLKEARKRLANHRHPDPPQGQWREIKIPVDVPFMNIVAAVCIRIISTPFAKETLSDELPPLYAGQPISANLSIHTTFHWGSSASDINKRYLLRFNIEEMVREWLVSGPKRGDFVAKDGETYTVPITLIALHHGEFALPKVNITALPMAGMVTMGSMAIPSIETYQEHGAQKVLVLPRGGRSTFVVGMGPG